jgi:hypothetical protein
LIALQGRTTLRTSANLEHFTYIGFELAYPSTSKTNKLLIPDSCGKYHHKDQVERSHSIGSTNHYNSKCSKVHDVFVSCSRLEQQHIKGLDKQLIYATLLFDGDAPIVTTAELGSTVAETVDLTANDKETTTTIVADPTSTETIDPASTDDSPLFPKPHTEISLKIWKLALPGLRFIMAATDGYDKEVED